MELNTIFFIGPQGSGKGTQARRLAERLKFFYWEMGGILREIAKTDTPLGNKVKALIDSGTLLSDQDLYEVVKARLKQLPKSQGVIFDGIPRRLGQAEFLFNYLVGQGRKNFSTLFVNLPKQESVNRLMLRAEKEKRADDTLEKIEFRLKQYEADTVPVLDYLKDRTSFFEIDGTPDIDTVSQNINKALGLND
ncbi:MAG: nucleoside monophosphate kinase [Candidatus Doudnabacteria bacterium]|nr:nucleoside monophosphate kinase [Candidatus Doudnabacteria bacterium]